MYFKLANFDFTLSRPENPQLKHPAIIQTLARRSWWFGPVARSSASASAMNSVGSASALPRLSRNNSKSGLASRERLGPWGLAAPHLATADGMLGSIGTRPAVRRPHRVQPLALQAAPAPLSSIGDDSVARTLDFLSLDGDGDAPPHSPDGLPVTPVKLCLPEPQPELRYAPPSLLKGPSSTHRASRAASAGALRAPGDAQPGMYPELPSLHSTAQPEAQPELATASAVAGEAAAPSRLPHAPRPRKKSVSTLEAAPLGQPHRQAAPWPSDAPGTRDGARDGRRASLGDVGALGGGAAEQGEAEGRRASWGGGAAEHGCLDSMSREQMSGSLRLLSTHRKQRAASADVLGSAARRVRPPPTMDAAEPPSPAAAAAAFVVADQPAHRRVSLVAALEPHSELLPPSLLPPSLLPPSRPVASAQVQPQPVQAPPAQVLPAQVLPAQTAAARPQSAHHLQQRAAKPPSRPLGGSSHYNQRRGEAEAERLPPPPPSPMQTEGAAAQPQPQQQPQPQPTT